MLNVASSDERESDRIESGKTPCAWQTCLRAKLTIAPSPQCTQNCHQDDKYTGFGSTWRRQTPQQLHVFEPSVKMYCDEEYLERNWR